MIPFILPGLSRFVPYGIAVLLLVSGVLYYGHTRYEAGQASEREWHQDYVARQNQVITRQQTENARLENAHDLLKFQHDAAIRAKLAADSRATDLAARLRRYYASQSALPQDAPAAPGTEGASGIGVGPDESGDGVDAAVQEVLTACRRDSIKLQGWQSWWTDIENSVNFTLTFPSG
jgi:hypothetical protein